ncbi:MAG TPA: hypothetical protein VGM76_13640 [Lacipirellulaceae bacterium]|jgi:hypothetical protein
MATDSRFGADGTRYDEPKKRTFWQSCLIGCLIVFAILLVLAVLAGVWVSQHWRGWASNFGSMAMKQMVADSGLAPDQKQAIANQIDRVADGFKTGRLSVEQMRGIMEKITQSPLMASITASAADKKYISSSGLTDAEKADGRMTVKRFASGVFNRKIDKPVMEAALAPISEEQSGGGRVGLKPIVSDDELRAFLKAAKEQADKAGIAEQVESVDAAGEFKKVVDEALKEDKSEAAPDAVK